MYFAGIYFHETRKNLRNSRKLVPVKISTIKQIFLMNGMPLLMTNLFYSTERYFFYYDTITTNQG